jgi:hypothetical protein
MEAPLPARKPLLPSAEVGWTLGRMDLEPPLPRQWRASDSEAVELCREWMIYLGAPDAVVAPDETRHVCDLYSSRFLAWVDNRRQNLDVDAVQNAANVAAADGRFPLVFVPGGIFPDAQDLADSLGVALLRFDSLGGDLDGVSAIGRQLRLRGLAAIGI